MRLQGTDVEAQARLSSVDTLLPSPGFGPITMEDLWKLADGAIDILVAAQRHVGAGNLGYSEFFPPINALLAVALYTVTLRETA